MRIRGGRYALLCVALCTACAAPDAETETGAAAAPDDAPAAAPAGPAAVVGQTLACVQQRPDMDRTASPYDSVVVPVGDGGAKICYSRPSARGRMVFDSLVPYGRLWRTGANEPTIFFTPVTLDLAGLKVPPGKYSLYSVPAAKEWEIIVNRSIKQWGEESNYTPEVRAQEVGRATVPSERLGKAVETFTIRSEPAGSGASLVLEWEKTRVKVPIRPG